MIWLCHVFIIIMLSIVSMAFQSKKMHASFELEFYR
jgi:hypothetical protein